MKKYRIGIIGIEHGHGIAMVTHGFYPAKKADVVAIAEPNRKLWDAHKGNFKNLRHYHDYKDMIEKEDLDGVSVTPVNSEKADAIVYCAGRKIHSIVDKPLLTELKDVGRVRSAVTRNKVNLSVMYTERTNPLFIQAKKIINSGRIGKVASIMSARPHILFLQGVDRPGWMFREKNYGGITVDLACHDTDMVRWLSGSEVTEVYAHETLLKFRNKRDFSDYASVHYKLSNGGSALLETDWFNPPSSYCAYTIIYGTEGHLFFYHQQAELVFAYKKKIQHIKSKPFNPWKGLAEDFLDSIETGRQNVLKTEDALRTSYLTLVARQSAKTGRVIKV